MKSKYLGNALHTRKFLLQAFACEESIYELPITPGY